MGISKSQQASNNQESIMAPISEDFCPFSTYAFVPLPPAGATGGDSQAGVKYPAKPTAHSPKPPSQVPESGGKLSAQQGQSKKRDGQPKF